MDRRPTRDRQGPRVFRWDRWTILALLAIASSVTAAILLLPFAVRGFVRAIEMAVDGCVWLAMSLSAGMSIWSVVGRVMRTAAALMISPAVTVALAVLVIVGVSAAYGLQRVLGSEEESS